MNSVKGKRPITIAIAAMGGQGGGVLANWIINAAEQANYLAQCTSVPGVAQRTGATVYYLEIFSHADAEQTGQTPVMALMPAPGDVDIVIAGELAEAGRALLRGFITAKKTILISSTHRDYALTEKMARGDGRMDHEKILQAVREASSQTIGFDMVSVAESTGSVISSVLFGALAGSDALPLPRQIFEEAIRSGGMAIESNLAGFAAGYEQTRSAMQNKSPPGPTKAAPVSTKPEQTLHPEVDALFTRIKNDFPGPVQEVLLQGTRKLVDYQDTAYARSYLNRLEKIRDIDNEYGQGANGSRLTIETARYLALWMSYEDTIRVADLKIRSSRFSRVRNEIHAGPEQIVQITEFMHPRVEEICDTLPAWPGAFILNTAWLRKTIGWFCRKGRKITTTKITGFLLLYCIAGLRRWRRSSYRYLREQAEVEKWLGRIMSMAPVNYELAAEIAQCQRLVKGYGETFERGMKNFHAIMSAIDKMDKTGDSVQKIKEMRDAALAGWHGDILQDRLN
ncbi:MAG: indolepyruvate oxidoreductase subunit beta family protein [Gammaproteobacteria bacterium]